MRIIVFITFFFIIIKGFSQSNNIRIKSIGANSISIINDTLSIDAATIVLSSKDSTIKYKIDYLTNTIKVFQNKPYQQLQIQYRVFPINFSQKTFLRNKLVYDSNQFYNDLFFKKAKLDNIDREEIFSSEGLNKSGSITRGITVGNNQDLNVNSAMNIQLDGKLSNELTIKAAITDQNIPIQPEGNTVQLQDFDRVFVQIGHKYGKLTVGDLQLKNDPNSYFLKYFKNVQGGQVQSIIKKDSLHISEIGLAASVSKGKFSSAKLDAIEGSLGPYRIKGPNNETFIIVMANSEKVYLDGILLQRGFNYDYIIDYNMAEITFMNKTIITKFSRIRVDFEYSERNFTRTNLAANFKQTIKNNQFYFNYYSEKDNPNQINPNVLSISNQDRKLLSAIGDTLSSAFVDGSKLTEFNNSAILYQKKDTIVNSILYKNIFLQSPLFKDSVYQLTFTDLGQGFGDYILDQSAANGRVYKWVAPVSGVKSGRYIAQRLIVTPKQKQMMNIGANIYLNKNNKLVSEIALSDNDLNLFSSKDDQNNQGIAIKNSLINSVNKISFLPTYKLQNKLEFEFLSKNFSPIDQFRYVEFDRDWNNTTNTQITNNITNNFNNSSDKIASISSSLVKNNENFLSYQLNYRNRQNQTLGTQQVIKMSQSNQKIRVWGDLFLMNNTLALTKAGWSRYQINAELKNKRIIPGYSYSSDKNKINDNKDTLISSSMYYDQHKFWLRSADSSKFSYLIEHTEREDFNFIKKIAVSDINYNYKSKTSSITLANNKSTNHDLKLNATYRELKAFDQPNIPSEETFMARTDLNDFWFNRHVRSEITFTSGTGRETKKQYVYIAVPTGQGNFTWRDANNDGIQQVNEFYEAINPDERNFIKSFVPSDQYIKAYTSMLNWRINIMAPRVWNTETGIKKFISRFSTSTLWVTDRKTGITSGFSRFIPFLQFQNDSFSNSNQLRQTLFFNRSSSIFGFENSYINSKNRQLLASGFEIRQVKEIQNQIRILIIPEMNSRIGINYSQKGNQSDYLLDKNYLVQTIALKPELTWQPSNKWRLIMQYNHSRKANISKVNNNNENLIWNELSTEYRLTKVQSRSLGFIFKYIQIADKNIGNFNSPIAYEMFEALQSGRNLTWSVNWQQRLINGLQLSLQYDGRKSKTDRTVHIGKMQVSALF